MPPHLPGRLEAVARQFPSTRHESGIVNQHVHRLSLELTAELVDRRQPREVKVLKGNLTGESTKRHRCLRREGLAESGPQVTRAATRRGQAAPAGCRSSCGSLRPQALRPRQAIAAVNLAGTRKATAAKNHPRLIRAGIPPVLSLLLHAMITVAPRTASSAGVAVVKDHNRRPEVGRSDGTLAHHLQGMLMDECAAKMNASPSAMIFPIPVLLPVTMQSFPAMIPVPAMVSGLPLV